MTDRRIHLVRHGEVDNPEGVLYGRLPGFPLSERGQRTAAAAAGALVALDRPIALIRTSPLIRAQQSAAPIAGRTGLEPELDDELIEASSKLEGGRFRMDLSIFAKPKAWPYLINPLRPSWGEPFTDVRDRMRSAVLRAADAPGDGDVVLVSHQLPIWMVHRTAVGKPLFHNPGARRCSLSSITSVVVEDGTIREVGYLAPGLDGADGDLIDRGAV